MITCYLQGGLGNQLFEIFTTISYAMESRTKFVFSKIYQLNNGNNGATIRYTYWSTFFSNLTPFLIQMENEDIANYLIIKEKDFSYNPLPKNENPEIPKMLVGYFQSPKYFDSYKETIFKLLKLQNKREDVRKKCEFDYDNIISIHFRLGDYKKLSDYHPIMTLDYYKMAIQAILDKVITNKNELSILYFCEDNDIKDVEESINELSYFFPDLKFVRASNNLDDWEQILQMSLCKYNIIANSTFSWWGAYFNTHSEKIVTYPSKWFGKKLQHNIKDLFPIYWTKIDVE